VKIHSIPLYIGKIQEKFTDAIFTEIRWFFFSEYQRFHSFKFWGKIFFPFLFEKLILLENNGVVNTGDAMDVSKATAASCTNRVQLTVKRCKSGAKGPAWRRWTTAERRCQEVVTDREPESPITDRAGHWSAGHWSADIGSVTGPAGHDILPIMDTSCRNNTHTFCFIFLLIASEKKRVRTSFCYLGESTSGLRAFSVSQ